MQPVVPDGNRDIVLSCIDINRWFGGLHALKGVSIDIRRGEILGLVGPNGSGKTTAVNAITGFFRRRKAKSGSETSSSIHSSPIRWHSKALRAPSRTWRFSRA